MTGVGLDAGPSVVSVHAFPVEFTGSEQAEAVLGLTRTTRAAVATVVATVLTRPVDD